MTFSITLTNDSEIRSYFNSKFDSFIIPYHSRLLLHNPQITFYLFHEKILKTLDVRFCCFFRRPKECQHMTKCQRMGWFVNRRAMSGNLRFKINWRDWISDFYQILFLGGRTCEMYKKILLCFFEKKYLNLSSWLVWYFFRRLKKGQHKAYKHKVCQQKGTFRKRGIEPFR